MGSPRFYFLFFFLLLFYSWKVRCVGRAVHDFLRPVVAGFVVDGFVRGEKLEIFCLSVGFAKKEVAGLSNWCWFGSERLLFIYLLVDCCCCYCEAGRAFS